MPPGALDSALKVDGHLLLLADDGTLAVYRRNGTAMLRLPFAEDRPKEVAWHPRNPKAFCTLHSACVRRGRPGARGAKRWKPFQVEKTEKTNKTPTPPYPSVPTRYPPYSASSKGSEGLGDVAMGGSLRKLPAAELRLPNEAR